MKRGLGFVLGSVLLSVFLLLPSRVGGQVETDGFTLSGQGEVGGRVFPERPRKPERGKFEEYREIPPGIFLEDLRVRLESKDQSYSVDVRARQPAEDDQNFLLRSAKLGRYEFEFEWDQIPHVFSRTGRSPYLGSSPGVFALPDFVRGTLQAASAAARPGLLRDYLATARDIDLETRWDTARFLLKFTPTPEWDLRAEYTRTRKEGSRPIGTTLSSFTNQVELPEPIEHTIHDVRLAAEWAREQWQLQFISNFSLFQNDVDVLVWDNPLRLTDAPFVASATGGTSAPARGRLDLAPDNVAYTVGLTGGVNLPWRSRLTGTFSYGFRFQDDAFVAPTINTAIVDPRLTLPAGSLDGEVHTRLFNLRLTSRPLPDISLGARYRFYDFDDRTPNLTFPVQVRTDTNLTIEPITTSRFSYTKHNAGADIGWRPLPPLSLKASYEWERWDRDARHREAPITDEHTPKATVDYTALDWLLLRASYARSWRRIDTYNPFAHLAHTVGEEEAEVEAPQAQSTLLRKYDEADRDRDRVDFLAMLTLVDTLTFTPTVSFRNDDYKGSSLGLQKDKSWAAGFDAAWRPMENVSLFGSYMREEFDARQRSRYRVPAGATGTPAAQLENPTYDWVSKNRDFVDTVGAGLDVDLIPKRLRFRLAYNFSQGTGKTDTFNPVTPTGGTTAQNAAPLPFAFPDFKDRLHRLDASVRYYLTPNWFTTLRYVFEKYDISDFRTDTLQPFMGGVEAGSGTSIYLGAQIRDYTAHILALTVGYRF